MLTYKAQHGGPIVQRYLEAAFEWREGWEIAGKPAGPQFWVEHVRPDQTGRSCKVGKIMGFRTVVHLPWFVTESRATMQHWIRR